MVDELIDHGLQLSPATDWSLMVSAEVALLLPMDADVLKRPLGQQPGLFRTHVYRDREVVTFPMTKPFAVLSDSAGLMPSLYLNLSTGRIGFEVARCGLSET